MSAYFVDMGSIVFELLTSPKSVPLGRIQVGMLLLLAQIAFASNDIQVPVQ